MKDSAQKNRSLGLLAGLAVILVLGGVGVALYQQRGGDDLVQPPPDLTEPGEGGRVNPHRCPRNLSASGYGDGLTTVRHANRH